jgi:basic amino acid/polyamine antiporter, APA family
MTRRNDTTSGVLNQAAAQAGLRRALGKWDLTAIGVNQVIGAAVFALPAALASTTGSLSPWLVAAAGIGTMMVAASFAEVGSRFEGTGGPYLYTRAAFGRFTAFEVGWLLWFVRVASWASVINVLATSLGYYWPALTSGVPRALLITLVIGVITFVNVRGIRQSSLLINTLTIGKLTPLVIFIAVGVFYIQPERFETGVTPDLTQLSTAALLLIFAYGGYETATVPAGEARDPRRAVPFALIMTIVVVAAVMTLIQIVAMGTLQGLQSSRTPLADAAGLFLGPWGAVLMTVGAVLSTTGNNMGQALSGPRNLFALAEQGDLPPFFGRIHPTFRTPANAILFTSTIALVLALTGTFTTMAAASAITRLIVYVATCASTLKLRDPKYARVVKPPTFVVPFGPVIPIAAIVMSLAILAGATSLQLMAGLGAIAAGAVLYMVAVRGGAAASAPVPRNS